MDTGWTEPLRSERRSSRRVLLYRQGKGWWLLGAERQRGYPRGCIVAYLYSLGLLLLLCKRDTLFLLP